MRRKADTLVEEGRNGTSPCGLIRSLTDGLPSVKSDQRGWNGNVSVTAGPSTPEDFLARQDGPRKKEAVAKQYGARPGV